MKHLRERFLMATALVVVPGLVVVLGVLPLQRRTSDLRQRIEALNREDAQLPRFAPPTREERALLEAEQPRVQRRIPAMAGDTERLLHYHRVVSGLQGSLQREGLTSPGMRSSWDPIRASFTLPGALEPAANPAEAAESVRSNRLLGWVLEVQVPGGTSNLFRALARATEPEPLLEPVGLRWEATPEEHRQHLLFRNLVLAPTQP